MTKRFWLILLVASLSLIGTGCQKRLEEKPGEGPMVKVGVEETAQEAKYPVKRTNHASKGKIDLVELVKNAKDGDVITIPEGVHTLSDSIKISNKKNLKLIGEGKCELVLNKIYLAVIDIEDSENITIENISAEHIDETEVGEVTCI